MTSRELIKHKNNIREMVRDLGYDIVCELYKAELLAVGNFHIREQGDMLIDWIAFGEDKDVKEAITIIYMAVLERLELREE